MARRVTIKTIARDLGISHMTVSRALSGNPRVRESTREMIRARADELGYVKSVAAVAMRGDRTTTVGLLLPNLINEFYARFANMLAANLEDAGLQLIIHLTSDEPSKERLALQKLREIQAGCVVLVPTSGVRHCEESLFQGLNVIQLIRQADMSVPARTVQIDDRNAFVDAVTHLAAKGHEKIAYIGGSTTRSSGELRISYFLEGLEQAGLEPVPGCMVTGNPSYEMGYEAVHSLIREGVATAVVCGGVELSNGALNGCLETGTGIPEDLAFIGYGDPAYYRWIGDGISTVWLPVDGLAEQVAAMITGGETTVEDNGNTTSLEARLIVR